MGIGSRIKEARTRLGLTQAELAKKIGVTKGAIANYESGISSPKIELQFRLFEVLGCDANYLYQDAFHDPPNTIRAPAFSSEAMEIAGAYDKADDGTQASVRKLLDVRRAPYIPDMEAHKAEAEALAQLHTQQKPAKK